jgi:UDP-N-acetylmuramyl pentapeptide phosphotransferase/UDP-N-acetylglucosamine-1-phosphate transferase
MNMNSILLLVLLLGLFWSMEWGYIKLAKRYAIIDKPNLRSSHDRPIVRGGGILFPAAWFVYMGVNDFPYPWMSLGLFLLSIVSFVDDIRSLPASIRFPVHVVSFLLCFHELGLFSSWPWWLVGGLLIVCIGTINAFNFMDGINGITGFYALTFLVPFVLATDLVGGIEWLASPFVFLVLSILVFGFYNFRKVAKCFAGDIGSIGLAYMLLFIVLQLATGEATYTLAWQPAEYLLLFAVYGIDSVLTIVQRLYLRQNIFEPHRMHLYQLLANERKIPHLQVSFLYAAIQSILNMYAWNYSFEIKETVLILLGMGIAYIWLKQSIYNRNNRNGQTINA